MMKELDEDGFRVVFFTNQAGIEKMKVKPAEIKDKIEAIITALDIPVLVSSGCACSSGRCRQCGLRFLSLFMDDSKCSEEMLIN